VLALVFGYRLAQRTARAFFKFLVPALRFASVLRLPPRAPSNFAIVETVGSMVAMFIGGENAVIKRLLSIMKAQINKKGQITIPWLIRAGIDARPGDELNVEIKGPGRFEVRKLTRRLPIVGSVEQEVLPVRQSGL
jgi:AbrB family looped-hinge helix DNA binding protein